VSVACREETMKTLTGDGEHLSARCRELIQFFEKGRVWPAPCTVLYRFTVLYRRCTATVCYRMSQFATACTSGFLAVKCAHIRTSLLFDET
jgi:hypothetical protein